MEASSVPVAVVEGAGSSVPEAAAQEAAAPAAVEGGVSSVPVVVVVEVSSGPAAGAAVKSQVADANCSTCLETKPGRAPGFFL